MSCGTEDVYKSLLGESCGWENGDDIACFLRLFRDLIDGYNSQVMKANEQDHKIALSKSPQNPRPKRLFHPKHPNIKLEIHAFISLQKMH